MADSIETRMSVTSIKRVDPYVKNILATATHVALYKFNTSANEWEKTETEGALFVYSRNGEPFHSIMVMNRLNTNNLIEPIVKNFDYQMQVPFLLYRNSKSKIFGIWFFNRDECINITSLIESIMEGFKEQQQQQQTKISTNNDKPTTTTTITTTTTTAAATIIPTSITKKKQNGVDIFSMLTKAQEDFNKTPTKQEPLLPTAFSSTPRVVDVTSKSVMDFFAKASSTKSTQKQIVPENNENVLQRLMSNPAHSVEHIEKQQRSVTPQEQLQVINKKTHVSPTDRRSVPISFPSTSTTKDKKETSPNQTASPLAFLLQSSHNQTLDETQVGAGIEGTSPFSQFLDNKPQLMTPMMFTTSNSSATIHDKIDDKNDDEQIDLLTEKQLTQALIHLLKTNSNFTKQIHEAYVNSIMERVKPTNNNFS